MSIDISSLDDNATDQATLTSYISGVDSAFQEMTKAATNLGASQTRINLQTTFVSSLMDTITTGISQLVDAEHERGIDQVAGASGQAAARRSGAQHCQPVEPEHSLALPLVMTEVRRG